jgi:hypothetical protein
MDNSLWCTAKLQPILQISGILQINLHIGAFFLADFHGFRSSGDLFPEFGKIECHWIPVCPGGFVA